MGSLLFDFLIIFILKNLRLKSDGIDFREIPIREEQMIFAKSSFFAF